MRQLPNLRPWIIAILAGGVVIPIAICVICGVGALLSAMGDALGGAVLNRIGLALAILWVLDLIVLVIFQGLNFLLNNHKNDDRTDES